MISFLLFAGIVILLFWVGSLNGRIAALEQRTRFLSSSAAAPRPETSRAAQSLQASPALSLSSAASSWASEPRAEAISKSDEAEVASNWLSKIGILALLFGVGFFLKFAIDQGWISQWTRVILGLATGSLFIVLGETWREKYKKYAPVLTGGGVALLYFSIFAAFQFYSLVPQAVAFACMVIVSVVAVGLAYRYKSSPLAVLAVAGAYLSPVLLHGSSDQQVKLFIYLGILNAATLAVLAKNYWIELLYLSFFGTVLDYILWASSFSSQENTLASLTFLIIILALQILGGAALFRKSFEQKSLPEKSDGYFAALTIFSGIFFVSAIYLLLYHHFHNILPLAGLLGAIIAMLAYVFVDRLEQKRTNYALSFAATALIALAAVWQYNGSTLDFLMIVLGLASVALGVFTKRAELRIWGLVLMFVSLLMVLFAPYDLVNYNFILNSKFALMAAQAAALLCASWLFTLAPLSDQEKSANVLTGITAVFLIWLAFSWELVTYFRGSATSSNASLLMSLWWIIYATIIITIGALRRSSVLRKAAIVLFGLSILKVFLYDVQSLELGYRVVSFIALGVILLSVSFAYQKNKGKITEFLEGEKTTDKV